ncbi:MAG: thermonuclease family protein [bacterium]|nr:thermonuclease family protein [bacterium]
MRGAEATAFLAGMVVEGDTVFLELGVEQRDRYGRLLAYVHTIDLEFVNMETAAAGYAEPLAIEPNTEWAADIANAADLAHPAAPVVELPARTSAGFDAGL